ncbi:MAG: iron-sulfur cluster carrier protein ApbC [Pseudomonadota bacterium]|nr:iron-sulfur cluster carrier protein ApbC [Pseudomonadota bacterium]
MAAITPDIVRAALSGIRTADGPEGIVAGGLVSEIVIDGDEVMFAIIADPRHARAMEPLRRAAEAAVRKLPGVGKVMVTLTAERPAAPQSARPAAAPRQERGSKIAGIRHIIAIASGKGGVGKSTTAVNLALGLQALGLQIGILDADVYGPSIPKLLGATEKPRLVAPDAKVMAPLERFGLKAMSMGFLVDEATPIVWRGPMVMGALVQMLREVAWGELDCLVVDLPPGTGDIQLTLAQQTPLSGAVIVSTPQDLALVDARKGLNMFRRVNVPILGIIENMSYFVCSKCGERHEIFGHGGARAEAKKLAVPFLGEVPLDAQVRERSDNGEPVVATMPQSLHASIYRDIASKLWTAVSGNLQAMKPPPRIVIEG